MLKAIIRNSPSLVAFIFALKLALSQPQRQHVTNVVDALVLGDGPKTLSALCALYVDSPDPKNVADTFRESPWPPDVIRGNLTPLLVQTAFDWADAQGTEQIAFASIDDSLTTKDEATRHLQAVDWHHDHQESTPSKAVYKNGAVHVLCRLQVGSVSFTVDMRLYLRAKTIRKLNRKRPPHKRLTFKSKFTLARQMLAQLESLIPQGYRLYVLFDSWYASAKLIRFCRRRGWHVICALRSNRSLNGVQVRHLHQRLRHQRYIKVKTTAADDSCTTYLVRSLKGQIKGVAQDVGVFISRRHYRDQRPRYYLCTDTSLSAQVALNWYLKRWSCEVANSYLKTRLGLGDFRVQSAEAIEKFYVVDWLALAYLEWRLAHGEGGGIKTLADVIRLHRTEHSRQTLQAACEMALESGDVEAVLARFAPMAA